MSVATTVSKFHAYKDIRMPSPATLLVPCSLQICFSELLRVENHRVVVFPERTWIWMLSKAAFSAKTLRKELSLLTTIV